MITQIFKKKQESYAQFCTCSLTSSGGAQLQKGEKFLARLQTYPSSGNIQVNRSKVVGLRKEKQSKLSLRVKQRKPQNLQTLNRVGEGVSNIYIRSDGYPNFSIQGGKQVVRDKNQPIKDQQKDVNKKKQMRVAKQICCRQELRQIKINNNFQVYEKANSQKSTYFSIGTQVKESMHIPLSKVNSKYLCNNNTSISAIEQMETVEATFLPRSKSFSTNLIKRMAGGQTFRNDKNQYVSRHLTKQESNQAEIDHLESFKLNDLRFKSAESFEDDENDQYSELASESQYQSHPNINEGNWSQSLNEILVKKMRRLSHNPDA